MIRRLLPRLLLLLLALASPARAHDIPSAIALTGFVRIEGGDATMVVRVPLVLLSDLDLPKRGPGYLDLERIGPALLDAGGAVGRAIRLTEGEALLDQRLLRGRVSLPGDRSFENLALALAHVRGPPLLATESVVATQGFFDAEFSVTLQRGLSALTLRVSLPRSLSDRLRLGVRLVLPDGQIRPFDIHGAEAEVRLDPDVLHAARAFLVDGTAHILGGLDHLLFLLCLIVPLRRDPWRLVGVVTAFTVGHSITLAVAALGFAPRGAWFAPTIGTLIAASIVWVAVENALGRVAVNRASLAACFGLVHGYGFAGALGDGLQFAGSHLLVALLAFNIGVELGQVLALLVVVPLLNMAMQAPVLARHGQLVIAVLVGHQAWHWMESRAESVPIPDLLADLSVIDPLRAVALLATLAAVVFALRVVLPVAEAGEARSK